MFFGLQDLGVVAAPPKARRYRYCGPHRRPPERKVTLHDLRAQAFPQPLVGPPSLRCHVRGFYLGVVQQEAATTTLPPKESLSWGSAIWCCHHCGAAEGVFLSG